MRRFFQIALSAIVAAPSVYSNDRKQPNVVIVITDDQGYGDLAFTGNPAIKTPRLTSWPSKGRC